MILGLLLELLYRVYIWFRQWQLPTAFPYYEVRRNRRDPFRTNLLFPRTEWRFDSPADSAISVIGDERRDRVLFHGCDVNDGEQLLISFERVARALAQVWIVLHFNGKTFTFDNPLALDQSSENTYSSDGIRLSCDAPMRRWRLAFNGVMIEAGTERTVHVKFGIRFSCGSHPFEWPKDLQPASLSAICQQLPVGTALNQLDRLYGRLDSFDQSGAFYADLAVDGVKKSKPFFGGRIKDVGTGALEGLLCQERGEAATELRHLIGYINNGAMIHCLTTHRHDEAAVPKAVIGCVFSPSHYMKPIRNGVLEKAKDGVTTLSLQAAHLSYQLRMESKGDLLKFRGRGQYTVQILTGTASVEGSELQVHLFEVTTSRSNSRPALPTHLLALAPLSIGVLQPQTPPLVVSTSDDIARQPSLTGGKGSSLAVLTALSKQYNNSVSNKQFDKTAKFTVPRAVVLTVNAYSVFQKQRDVTRAIEELRQTAASSDNVESLREGCVRCESVLMSAALPPQVGEELSSALVSCFGTGWQSRRFAVRSSAVGEDSEEMSAAGQMTTFLGVHGIEDIEKSVVKCWASQFAFTAVQYKRQYGESVCSRMAVVVQEMVDAEAAGVMFTCEPVTSNPLFSAITANLGLGESVVSATAEPDTFLVDKTNDSSYVVSEKTVGAKSAIIEQSPSGGTITRPASQEEAANASIEDTVAVRLAKVGAIIDHSYGVARDIEWAIKDGEIYLLQCRPVTSVFRESDYEIAHDDNTALRTDRELLSRANLDEVLPGCLSSLTLSMNQYIFDNLTKYNFIRFNPGVEYERSPFVYVGSFCIGKKWYMNLSEPGFKGNSESMVGLMLAMFGRDISDEEAFINSIGHERPPKWYTKLGAAFYMLKGIFNVQRSVESARAMEKTFKLEINDEMTSKQMIDAIIYGLHQMDEGGLYLMAASMPSMMMNLVVLNTIANVNGTEPSAPETTALFSRLVKSNFDVESANIPASMTKLATAIRHSSKGSEFSDMSDEDALKWLRESDEAAAKAYRDFISRHGHRCYKEFDLMSDPWELDPLKLIRSLKASVAGGERASSDEDGITLDELPKTPSRGQRFFLNWALPRAKYAVYAREATKSSLIFVLHKVRLAVRALGRRMEQEGRLPSANLVHFLSFEELHRLVHSPLRSPTLVTRAIRRSRLHPKIDKLKYHILQCGMPKPLDAEDGPYSGSASQGTELQGTPVSEGVIEGPARVILDFEEEAHLIQRGEILVTHATDTGWTPYFPLLGGVVTAIGGFLSHGAVVAREFGLPAVVGVRGVTQRVSQGDIIRVDGARGVVTILETQTATST